MTAPDPRVGEPIAYRPENRQEATDDLIRMLTESADIPGNVRLPRDAVNMLLAELRDRDEKLARATVLIRELTDPDGCEFDHHGGCQAHGYLGLEPGETCPQRDGKEWVLRAAVAAASGGGDSEPRPTGFPPRPLLKKGTVG